MSFNSLLFPFLSLCNLFSLFAWIFLPKLRKTAKKVSRERSWDVPGRSPESQGDPRRLRGSPGRVPGSVLDPPRPPLGAIWAPFRMPFFVFFSFEFPTAFFYNFGRHSGSIFAPFWLTKSASEPPGRKKVDMRKPLFYLGKTILFELGGSPGLPKSLPKATSEFKTFFHRFFLPKSPENGSRMGPKMIQKSLKSQTKMLKIFSWILGSKRKPK